MPNSSNRFYSLPCSIFLKVDEDTRSWRERFQDYFEAKYTTPDVVESNEGMIYNFTLDEDKRNKDIFVVDSNLDPWTFKAKGATFEWEGPWEGEWDDGIQSLFATRNRKSTTDIEPSCIKCPIWYTWVSGLALGTFQYDF